MVSRILLFVVIVGTASAATWMGKLPMKPKEFAHEQGCYIEEINKVIPFGSTLSPIGVCYSIDCTQHMIHYSSCGVVYTDDPKCYITEEDVSKPYPYCCKEIKCDLDNNIL